MEISIEEIKASNIVAALKRLKTASKGGELNECRQIYTRKER